MQVTKQQMADAFTEWDRRYRECPEDFTTDVEHLLGNTAYSNGRSSAAYFCKMLKVVA